MLAEVAENDRIGVMDVVKATVSTRYHIPFFQYYVQAGFPSPAENYLEKICDLNDLCVSNAEATYFVRVRTESMIGDHIVPGSVLVVDSSLKPIDGKIVIAWVNGEHAVKRIHFAGNMIVLLSSNPAFEPIYVHEGDDFRVFGVVTFVIHKPL